MTEKPPAVVNRAGAPDARSLSPQARADLRRDVVVAVRGGMTRLEAARRYGVSRRTVGIWVRAYQVGGAPAKERPRGRPANPDVLLTPEQEASILLSMRAANPCVLGMLGQLWTRRAVADLIRIESGHEFGAACVEHYLNRWRLTVDAFEPTSDDLDLPWMPDPNDFVPGSRTLRFSWHTIAAPGVRTTGHPPVSAELWQVLVAESGHGGSHFRLPPAPVEFEVIRMFGRHLVQQVQRNVHLMVHRWPADQLHLLEAWRADPGPALVVTGALHESCPENV